MNITEDILANQITKKEVHNMKTVITILDNGKLLKPQTLEDGELTPLFKIKKTEIQGKCKFEEESEYFTNLANNFESQEEYEKAKFHF